jgi:hypothetical protein
LKSVLVAAALLAGAAAPAAPLLVREQAWTAHSATLAYDLTHTPGECVDHVTSATEIGRALFRSPGMLGGPVARLGVSCNSCHSGARVNARFFIPELTDRIGAADTTSEWASKVRGDGVMNPRDIPDLAGIGVKQSFGHLNDPSLEHFVHSVIVDEFQGAEPPPQAFESIIAYLRAQNVRSCPPDAEAVTLRSAADDVRRAMAAAATADDPTAHLVLLAAQDAMGRIVERLPTETFAADRQRLENLSREIGALRDEPDIPAAMQGAAPGWQARFDAEITRLSRRERRTYFNERTLRHALAAPPPS